LSTETSYPNAAGGAQVAKCAVHPTTQSANNAEGRPIQPPLHPVVDDYADLTHAELRTLRESLRSHGLCMPVVVWRGRVVDGRHRVALCRELGIEVRYDDITDRCPTEAEMRAHVQALNEHRRANTKPLTTAEKQARIEAALKVDPARSDRAISQEIGVSQPTVSATRRKLESRGVQKFITPSDRKSKTGKKGEGQRWTARTPARRPKPSRYNLAIALNSLSWSEASPELRRNFIDAVGLKAMWDSASPDQRAALREHIHENERHNDIVISAAAATAAPESDDPFAIPTFLQRKRREAAE
jgi:ParB-like chromosome segregation protein Spo0J